MENKDDAIIFIDEIQQHPQFLTMLYLNDVGLLTNILYKNNIAAILNDESSINLGSVYESIFASELKLMVSINIIMIINKMES